MVFLIFSFLGRTLSISKLKTTLYQQSKILTQADNYRILNIINKIFIVFIEFIIIVKLMINNLKLTFGIVALLFASRFIPHPPNFTNLIALSYYLPLIFGRKSISLIIFSYILTDLIIGIHSKIFFTWGSVILIGLLAPVFKKTIIIRLVGCLFAVLIFYSISNFGAWISGLYTLDLNGFIECYFLALPFLGYSIVSTIIYSALIETVLFFYKFNSKLRNIIKF